MSLLTLLQDVSNEVGLGEVSSVVGSTNIQTKQLLAKTYRVGRELRDCIVWPQLTREHTITLVTDQANYALPADFDRQLFETHWNQSSNWPLIGPISPQEWRARKDGVTTTSARQYFRIKNLEDKQIYIEPTPASGDNGNTLIFEYQSTVWFRPVTWTASASFGASTYCYYNGNFYSTTAGGTTGSTAPTHTTGSASDGGVTWVYESDPYTTFQKDTDILILDELLVGLGVQWQILRQKGLPFEAIRDDFEAQLRRRATALKGARTLNLNRSSSTRFLVSENIPDTGYGS